MDKKAGQWGKRQMPEDNKSFEKLLLFVMPARNRGGRHPESFEITGFPPASTGSATSGNDNIVVFMWLCKRLPESST